MNDGLRGRDSIVIEDGTITVSAGGDGMQANNDEDPSQGFVEIEGGTLNITAAADGGQAATTVLISGGSLTVSPGGGSISSSSADSGKAIKSDTDLTIEGGTFTVDSADDALPANGSLTITGGSLTLATSDDAIHADSAITIDGGDINITTCYEGLESAEITVKERRLHLVSSADGFNVSDGSGGGMGGPGLGGPWGGPLPKRTLPESVS